ncbi:DDE_3 domain-containing protein [Trichonephila clavipes]|nr:DDE_3 domain-containing protein [Trichonephila clavipes]
MATPGSSFTPTPLGHEDNLESRFCLTSDSCHTFIWREPSTHYPLSNVQEIDHYCSGSLIVLAGITDGHTHLHVFQRGAVTDVKYRDEVLEPYVRLLKGAIGRYFRLMDDNAWPHKVHLFNEF